MRIDLNENKMSRLEKKKKYKPVADPACCSMFYSAILRTKKKRKKSNWGRPTVLISCGRYLHTHSSWPHETIDVRQMPRLGPVNIYRLTDAFALCPFATFIILLFEFGLSIRYPIIQLRRNAFGQEGFRFHTNYILLISRAIISFREKRGGGFVSWAWKTWNQKTTKAGHTQRGRPVWNDGYNDDDDETLF